MRARILDYLHLGDKVACCLALYNMAKYTGKTIAVNGDEVVAHLVKRIGLEGLEWSDTASDTGERFAVKDFFGFLENARIPFFATPSIDLDFKPKKFEEVRLPAQKTEPEELTLFQFDSRSQNDNKKTLSRKEAMYFLKAKANFKAVGIGGPETKRYLPYEYELGNLSWIIEKMRSAGQFVGVDSGMSHIAGILGVPSDIYLMHKNEFDVKMVERFYEACYPNTRCTHDFSGNGGRIPRLKIF